MKKVLHQPSEGKRQMQPQPLIRGAIVLVRAGPNFECLLACREWHALQLTGSTNESRIQADCDWVPTCSNTPLHPKNSKKSLATPMGTVTNGVILRALGGYMRKFKTRRLRALPFRSLLILAGALMLLAAFAPRANADLIAYYNFEGPDTPGFPVNLDSHPPAFFSSGNTMTLSFNVNALSQVNPGLPQNLFPGDPAPNLTALGLSRSGANSPAHFDIPLNSAQGFFQTMTVSFAINAQGNGFTLANVLFSTNGGGTFTLAFSQVIPSSGTIIVSGALPAAANNTPLLTVRIELTGGQSNGSNLQNVVDNIQINGTIVPEPSTVAAGLLGVLGLCWHQRRRLIRSVRFGKA